MDFYSDKLRAIRLKLKCPATRLARLCDVTRGTIHRWENGTMVPSKSRVYAISRALNISTMDISDVPDTRLNPNSVIEKIKSIDSLAKTDYSDLEDIEADFIKQIKKQRKETGEAVLVINALLQTMHSAFYVKNIQNKYVVANSAFLEIIASPVTGSVAGKTDVQVFPKNEANENSKIDQAVLDLDEKIVDKQMYIAGTRKNRWGIITKVPILNREGVPEGMLCTIKDITEEKKANELNKELQTAISNIQDVVWTGMKVDYRIKYTTVNEATENLLGLTEEEFRNGEWKKHIHPEFMNDVEKSMKGSGTGHRQVEYKYNHPINGKTLWLQHRVNIDGQYRFGVIRDVTETRLQQIEMEYLFECLSNMDSMFWVAESDKERKSFKYHTVSKGIEKIFARTRHDLEKNSLIWEKRFNPGNIHAKGNSSFEVGYLLGGGEQQDERWIHEVIYEKGNMLFGLTSDMAINSFTDRGSKKLLEKAIGEISHGVILYSEGRKQCYYANNSAAKIFEIGKNDFAKENILERVLIGLKTQDTKSKNKTGKEKNYIAEYSVNGKTKWLEIAEKPFSFYEIECTLLMAKDITKEKELENLQEMILHSFKKFKIAFSVLDRKLNRTIFDYGSRNVFSIPADIPKEKHLSYWLSEIVHPADRDQERQYVEAQNWPKHRRYRIITKDNKVRWIEVFREEKGSEKRYLVGFMRDITESVELKSFE